MHTCIWRFIYAEDEFILIIRFFKDGNLIWKNFPLKKTVYKSISGAQTFVQRGIKPESIEKYIEGKVFSRAYDLAPSPQSPLLSRQ